jgi:FtsP/CotA-like multicopper oxidase with cupredoxin domain
MAARRGVGTVQMSRRSGAGSAGFTRRQVVQLGLGLAGAAVLGQLARPGRARADGPPPTPIRFTPFTRELPTIANGMISVAKPVAFASTWDATLPGARKYLLRMRKARVEIIPGVTTEIWGYEGAYPGPAIVGRTGIPDVVRFVNKSDDLPTPSTDDLDVFTTVHQHGGHNPSDSDGLPLPDQLIEPGAWKDFGYPNAPQKAPDGTPDPSENPSLLWYHDHATDITGPNVYMGLAGLYPMVDDLEEGLVASGALPPVGSEFDVPLVLQDRRFNADGSLFYSPFEHDGFLGDVMVVNGKAQPYLDVQRRRYRLRILVGTNARMFLLRLSTGAPFLVVGSDRWLLPHPVQRGRLLLGMAECADVIVDFSGSAPGDRVYLEDLLSQDSGRGPGGTVLDPAVSLPGRRLLEFRVRGGVPSGDLAITPTTALRPHTPIGPAEIVATRTFEFNRSNGAWQVNGRFYDEERTDAAVKLGTAERWILKNGGGGWWHPIHIHLALHQVQRFGGAPPPFEHAFKKDTTLLGPGDVAEVFLRFRDHAGRFVAHCHNMEHEDDRMMFRFDTAE